MKKGIETKLTSVKVYSELFENFKKDCIDNNFSFTKLVIAAMDKYMTDPQFKQEIRNYRPKVENDITRNSK